MDAMVTDISAWVAIAEMIPIKTSKRCRDDVDVVETKMLGE